MAIGKGVSIEVPATEILITTSNAFTYTQLPAHHPFYGMVGRVASEWSHIEHVLDATIWDFTGVAPEIGACLTSQIMGVGPRCKAIISLCGLFGLSDEIKKGYRKLMSDSYPIADGRARVVHDPWYLELSSETPGQFKAMPYSDQRHGHMEVTKAEIEDLLKEILKLRRAAQNLRSQTLGGLQASRGKPAPAPAEAPPPKARAAPEGRTSTKRQRRSSPA